MTDNSENTPSDCPKASCFQGAKYMVPWRRVARSIVPVTVNCTPLRRRVIFQRSDNLSAVVLTFDDGPHPDHTPALLDVLAEHDIRATFFVVGKRAKKYPSLIRRIAAAGHAVANHGFSHVKCSSLPFAEIMMEIDATDDAIRSVGVSPVNLFRPPWGSLTPLQVLRLVARGRRLMFWSLASNDHVLESAEIVSRCLYVRRRDIILFHDHNRRTRIALPRILNLLANRGLKTLAYDDSNSETEGNLRTSHDM